jgi:hypothetical protein
MSKQFNLGKISVTVFLTALIWVWADLAQDEPLELTRVVSISVARSTDPNLWIALETQGSALRSSLVVERVEFKGPASRVAEVERLNNKGKLDLNLFLVGEELGLTETTVRTVDTLEFLKQCTEIRQLGLTVETCEPKVFTVHVRRLERADVAVECVDEKGSPIVAEVLEPSRVSVPVPPGEVLVARVRLSAEEQRQARQSPVEKKPYVELADGQRRDAAEMVKIKLPPTDDVLQSYPVAATLGFCMSQNLQGKYRVELREDPTVNPVMIEATPSAYQEYDKTPFHMVLYIEDSDKVSADYISRNAVLNFPEEYVRRGEIKLDQAAPRVQFRLVPLPAEKPTTPPEPPQK